MQVAQAKADSMNGECVNFLVEHNGRKANEKGLGMGHVLDEIGVKYQ